MSLEDELAVMVALRDRSVGMDQWRANCRIAQLQKAVPVLKAHLSLEEYLSEEFTLLRVTPHITHIKLPQESYYTVVTVASRYHIPYPDQVKWLGGVFAEARAKKKSDLGTFILNAYAEGGFGVALCHHLDSFNRRRGRIIAKGRLLRSLRRGCLR